MPHFQKKRIVYVFGSLRVGGTEKQVVETAIGLNRDFFEPKLFCLSGGGDLKSTGDHHGIEATIYHPPHNNALHFIHYFRKLLMLYQYLKRERPDIVHCYLLTPSIYGGIAAKLANIPILITSRRCLGYFKDDLNPFYQLLENFVNRFTDRILVNSQAVKHDVLQRENVDVQKIHVIYNGINIHEYKPLDGRTELHSYLPHKKHELGIPETAPVIGMIANLIPYKGYRDFLLAASEIHHEYPEARFLCIGEDRGIKGELEQLCQELSLRQHVVFTGKIHNIPEMLHLLDIQVSASHQEGFSNAILEGMASGKPVVATSVGGTPEAIVHDVTGLLVPPCQPTVLAKAIISLLARPECILQFGRNGRRRVEEYFSFEKMIDKLEKLYIESFSQKLTNCTRKNRSIM